MYTYWNLALKVPESNRCVESQCIIFAIYLCLKNSEEFPIRKIRVRVPAWCVY